MHNRKLLNIELGRVSAEEYKELPDSGIVIVLDNIRSAHNVGSAFRTADSFKIDKVWLCGICALPPSAEIHKSALGAEDSVAWEHADDTMEAVRRLKEEGMKTRLILQIHDELILEAPDGEAEKAAKLLTEVMESAAELKVPLTAESNIAKNWYDTKIPDTQWGVWNKVYQ